MIVFNVSQAIDLIKTNCNASYTFSSYNRLAHVCKCIDICLNARIDTTLHYTYIYRREEKKIYIPTNDVWLFCFIHSFIITFIRMQLTCDVTTLRASSITRLSFNLFYCWPEFCLSCTLKDHKIYPLAIIIQYTYKYANHN